MGNPYSVVGTFHKIDVYVTLKLVSFFRTLINVNKEYILQVFNQKLVVLNCLFFFINYSMQCFCRIYYAGAILYEVFTESIFLLSLCNPQNCSSFLSNYFHLYDKLINKVFTVNYQPVITFP